MFFGNKPQPVKQKFKYYRYRDKIYKLVYQPDGMIVVQEWDEKRGMFFPAAVSVREYDIQTLGSELPMEEVLKIVR